MRSVSGIGVAVLTAVLALAQFDLADAQYYYQPAPDYYRNDTAGGTVVGGKDDRGEGALIGAGVGAITGNLLGRAKDRADHHHAATGAAVVAQANQQAAAQAVTNYDLVGMTRAGVSEDLIINTMRSRGSRLDLSPQGLIALKDAGVSDRVVMAAQGMGSGSAYVAGPAVPIVREVVPTTVIVEPGWRPYRYRHYYHRPHYHRPHTHIHYGVSF